MVLWILTVVVFFFSPFAQSGIDGDQQHTSTYDSMLCLSGEKHNLNVSRSNVEFDWCSAASMSMELLASFNVAPTMENACRYLNNFKFLIHRWKGNINIKHKHKLSELELNTCKSRHYRHSAKIGELNHQGLMINQQWYQTFWQIGACSSISISKLTASNGIGKP